VTAVVRGARELPSEVARPAGPTAPAHEGGLVTRYIAGRGMLTLGAAITATVLPLIAATLFDANSTEMGAIVTISMLASLATQIPIGAWSDRRTDQLRLLIVSSAVSVLLILLIPMLWYFDSLTLTWLYVGVLLTALVGSVRASLGHAILNDLTLPHSRMAAVGRLSGATNGAEVGGQAAGGAFIAVMPAPLIPLVEAVLSIVATFVLRTLPGNRQDEHEADSAPKPSNQSEKTSTSNKRIVAWLGANGGLWLAVLVGAAGGFVEPILILYFIRDLQIPAALVGPLVALGALAVWWEDSHWARSPNAGVRAGHASSAALQ